MKKETTIQAKTKEEALKLASVELSESVENLEAEMIEEGKKGFLGMGATPSTFKITYIFKPVEAAKTFATSLVENLGLNATVIVHDDGEGEALMTISGDDASKLIGHHGDTLNAFQYLVNLAANKKEDDARKYTHVSVDIENYREKRESTLKDLAEKMAEKVKRTGRNVTLEPMDAYSRRVIHATIQSIEGVSTNSVGSEGNRRVVIYLEGSEKPTEESVAKSEKNKSGKKGSRGGSRNFNKRDSKSNKKSDSDYIPKRDPSKPRPQPRKIEKAKDLDSYFEKLKEFSSSLNSTDSSKQ